MRIAVALIPVLAFATMWQPAYGQNPSGGYVSSLMPMPRVAQYSAPSTGPGWSRPYEANGPAWGYNAVPSAAPMNQTPYSGYGAGGWNSASYRPVSTPGNPGDPHHAGPPAPQAPYANQPAPYANQPARQVPQHEQPYYPQPQAVPNQYYQQHGAAASGGGAYVDAAGAAGGACDGYGYGGGYGAGYGAGYGDAYGYDAGYGYGYGYGGGGYGSVLGSRLFNRGGCCHWQVSAAALFMGRIDNNKEWFSYIDGADEIQLGNGIENFGAGLEIGLTRRFCTGSGTYAFQAKYWGIFPSDWETQQADSGYGSSIFSVYDFDPLVVDHPGYPGTPIAVNDYYDGAQLHVVRRSWEVHNLEVNMLGGGLLGDGIGGWGITTADGLGGGACGSACGGAYGGACGGAGCKAGGCGGACGGAACGCGDGCGPRLNMGWLFGVRFLYFNDALQFATDQVDHDWNWDLDEMYYDIDVDNYLIGLQLGYGGDWCITPKLHLRTGTKFGVYGTHINHVSQIHGEMGSAYVSAGPNAGYEYDVSSSETNVSFLGEIDVALAYHITRRCVGKVGYRVVAVTGVAVADGQIPRHFAGIQDVADIDSKDNLVLHGAYVGLEYCW